MIGRLLALAGALWGVSQVFSSKKTAPPPAKNKLGHYTFVERVYGPEGLEPRVVLLLPDEGSTPDAALDQLGKINGPARVFALLGDRVNEKGYGFVDPIAADRAAAEVDASVSLSAAAAEAVFRFSPQQRIIVAGFGRSGTLAALLALFGGVAVRRGLAAGGGLTMKQVPLQAGADAPVTILTWGPELTPTEEAAKVAADRGLKIEVIEYDGEGAPAPDVLGTWLNGRVSSALA